MPHKHQMHLLAVAVHIYGAITLPDVTPDIPIIEDCAQAHGASLGGVKAGKFGTVAAWSMYPTKNLGALGDAGAITTDDEEIADTVRGLAKYGTPNRPGINSRLDPLQAAFLRVKLPYLDGWNARRAENAAAYLETIDNAMIELPAVDAESKPAWHIFAIEVNDRDELAEYLRDYGVETMVHYPSLPYPSDRFRVPDAEWWAQSTISLPVAPHVTPEQCRYIGELVNTWATLKQFS